MDKTTNYYFFIIFQTCAKQQQESCSAKIWHECYLIISISSKFLITKQPAHTLVFLFWLISQVKVPPSPETMRYTIFCIKLYEDIRKRVQTAEARAQGSKEALKSWNSSNRSVNWCNTETLFMKVIYLNMGLKPCPENHCYSSSQWRGRMRVRLRSNNLKLW